ncbi:MAG: TonB-dependent receptor, partial [Acidobacteria bacterium]|nr:TonB-dependent receptor [Acidobacteriota bacterium]
VYNLTTLLGSSHSIRAGADIRRQALDDRADNFSRGFYTFRSVCAGTTYSSPYAAFLDGCVSTFTTAFGPFFLENRINEYNAYAQDDWQPSPNLTVNLGVRYEYVAAPREIRNRIQYNFGDDKYVEPRLGFAYSPGWQGGFLGWLTGGPGNASIRGGYGVYHGRLFQSVFSQGGASVRTNPPNAISLSFTNTLNLADPTNGFVFTPGPQNTRHSETLIDPGLKMPYTRQWNLTFERKIPWNSTVRLSYTGNRGVGLLRYQLGNLPVTPEQGGIVVVNDPNNAPGAGFPDLRGVRIDRYASDFRCAGTGLPGIPVNPTCPVAVPIANNEIGLRVPRTNERRPDPRFTSNLIVSNGSSSTYNGVQLEVQKSFDRWLQFQMSYTFSKATDDVSEATAVGAGDTNVTSPDERFTRALSRFDTRHRFVFFGAYQLPIFRTRTDLLGKLLGGWQLSTVVRLASGTPFTVVDTGAGDLSIYGYTRRPVLVNPSVNGNRIDDPGTSQTQLPRDGFRRSTPNDPPETLVGRNTFFTDATRTVDLGLYKAFATFPGQAVVLRLEVYNLFNRTQFGFPVSDFASDNFGQLVSTSIGYSARTFQLGVRYAF